MSGAVYSSHPMLPFGIVACTFFPTTSLEIAVWVNLNALINVARLPATKGCGSLSGKSNGKIFFTLYPNRELVHRLD